MRVCQLKRNTNETKIELSLNLDGNGNYEIKSGCGFLDHMLELFTRHGQFDLNLSCEGDTYIDYHHTVEDIGIALGTAFNEAMADKKGIYRYGDMILPMDEALILCAVDISGRAHLSYDVQLPCQKVGDFDTELVEEFLLGFVRNCNITLHVNMLSGSNTHHIIEGIFKCLARVLNTATTIDQNNKDRIPSTKGVL